MNLWQRLNLEPTDDIRLIKRAYAKQLKQCKPDEKPTEFQALYAAYQHALELAHNAQQHDAQDQEPQTEEGRLDAPDITTIYDSSLTVETANSPDDAHTPALAIELPIESAPSEPIIVTGIDYTQAEFEQYLHCFCQYIKEQDRSPAKNSWQVFLDAPFLQQPKLLQSTSFHIFDSVISLCSTAIDGAQTEDSDNTIQYHLEANIHPALLVALNAKFDWLGKRIELEDVFDLNAVDYLLDLIVKAHKLGKQQRAFVRHNVRSEAEESSAIAIKVKRAVAFWLIDIPLLATASYLLANTLTELNFIDAALILFIGYFSLLESSLLPVSASFGKLLLGLKVSKVDRMRPIPIYQSFWRALVSIVFVLLAKVTFFITLLVTQRNFLNDLVSATRVVEVRHSTLKQIYHFFTGKK